jgi:hypothetical protein
MPLSGKYDFPKYRPIITVGFVQREEKVGISSEKRD